MISSAVYVNVYLISVIKEFLIKLADKHETVVAPDVSFMYEVAQ